MASTTDPAPATGVTGEPQSPLSDNDGGERPVRKQLKETTIKSAPTTSEEPGTGRKRSFEDSRDEPNSPGDNDDNGETRRKRSRDCTPLDDIEVTTSLDASASAKSENVSAIYPMDSPLAAPVDVTEKYTSPGPKTGLLEHESSENSANDCTWKNTSWVPYDESVICEAWLEMLNKKSEHGSGATDSKSRSSQCSEDDTEILPDSEDEQSEEETHDPEQNYEPDQVHEPINSPVYSPAHHFFEFDSDSTLRAQSAPLGLSHVYHESESRSKSVPALRSNRYLLEPQPYYDWLPPPEYFELDNHKHPAEPAHSLPPFESNGVATRPTTEWLDVDPSTIIRDDTPVWPENTHQNLYHESAYQFSGPGNHPQSPLFQAAQPVSENAHRSTWRSPFELGTPSPFHHYWEFPKQEYPDTAHIIEPLEAKYDPTLEQFYGTQPCSIEVENNEFKEPNQLAELNELGNSVSQQPVQSSLEASNKSPSDQDSDESELEIFPPDPSDHDSVILKREFDDWPSTPSEKPSPHFSSEKELSSPRTPTLTEPDHGNLNDNNDTNTKLLQDPKRSSTTQTPSSTMDDESKVLNKKRSREQLEDSGLKNDTKDDTVQEPTSTNPADTKSTTDGEREKKRHRDDSQERETKTDNAFAASAFGKAAAASPFASLGSTADSANKPASTSAFASSSLSAFAGSEKSPFGTLGASTSSVFKPATTGTSSFASPSTTSGFGALGSGFSGVGGGFAAAAKPGGLTSFASSNAPATLGGTKAKAFGAEDSEGDESDNNEDEEDTSTFEAAKTDERFFEQNIETGEEEETTLFSCKAKLFGFVNKEWRERGIGTFKLNARPTDDGYSNGRMIMRADGAMRVMLNSPIFDGMNYGDTNNNAPTTKQIFLTGTEEGRTVPMLLRTGNENLAHELHEHIKGLLGKSD